MSATVDVENWTRHDVQFRFLYPEGMAPGELKRNAPCPSKMKVPEGATAFVWRIKKDENPNWIPTQNISFDPPLSASSSEPRRVVLKFSLKIGGLQEDAADLTSAPPTPVSQKLLDTHGPGSKTDASYKELIDHLQKTKSKFVDGSFDPTKQNCTTRESLDWVRPSAISRSPKLFPKGDAAEALEVDLRQGNIGNCWFVATLAMLYSFDRTLLYNLLVEYRPKLGIVLCRFCKEGEWQYVLIDDRLPVVGSRLCYAHHEDRDLFWGPFLEKAYAKLHGGYDQIIGGRIQYAATDLTGHFSENVRIRLVL